MKFKNWIWEYHVFIKILENKKIGSNQLDIERSQSEDQYIEKPLLLKN